MVGPEARVQTVDEGETLAPKIAAEIGGPPFLLVTSHTETLWCTPNSETTFWEKWLTHFGFGGDGQ